MDNILPFRNKSNDQANEFTLLIRPHGEHLYRVAFRLCGNQSDAEDLVQELFLKLYSKRTELGKIESLKPWLAKSLYRLYVDNYRHESRSPISELSEAETLDSPAPKPDQPDQILKRERQMAVIQVALDKLGEEHRALIILCDVEGYSIEEVQQVLDIPSGTVKSRLHRARAKLREMIKNRI